MMFNESESSIATETMCPPTSNIASPPSLVAAAASLAVPGKGSSSSSSSSSKSTCPQGYMFLVLYVLMTTIVLVSTQTLLSSQIGMFKQQASSTSSSPFIGIFSLVGDSGVPVMITSFSGFSSPTAEWSLKSKDYHSAIAPTALPSNRFVSSSTSHSTPTNNLVGTTMEVPETGSRSSTEVVTISAPTTTVVRLQFQPLVVELATLIVCEALGLSIVSRLGGAARKLFLAHRLSGTATRAASGAAGRRMLLGFSSRTGSRGAAAILKTGVGRGFLKVPVTSSSAIVKLLQQQQHWFSRLGSKLYRRVMFVYSKTSASKIVTRSKKFIKERMHHQEHLEHHQYDSDDEEHKEYSPENV